MTNDKMDFIQGIKALEILMKQMESGKLSLDQSLSNDQTSISLIRQCQQVLDEVEQKVFELSNQGNYQTPILNISNKY